MLLSCFDPKFPIVLRMKFRLRVKFLLASPASPCTISSLSFELHAKETSLSLAHAPCTLLSPGLYIGCSLCMLPLFFQLISTPRLLTFSFSSSPSNALLPIPILYQSPILRSWQFIYLYSTFQTCNYVRIV